MPSEIMIVAVVRAKSGHEESVAGILKAAVGPSRAEQGCRLYDLHQDHNVRGRFVFIERWADQEALAAHERQPHFQRLEELLPPHVEGESEVMILDLLEAP